MKPKPSTLLLLLCVVPIGASVAYAAPPIAATGKEHTYEIPRHLEKDYSSILYPGDIQGDDVGSTVSLLISHSDFPNIGLKQPWDATLLLFWDRDYGASGGIVSVGRRVSEDAEPAGQVGAFHRYRKSLGAYQRDYYLNFDPGGVGDGDSEGRYYVKTFESEAVEIGQIKKPSKLHCQLHSVYDGIAFQFSTSGSNCEIGNFDSIHAAVMTIFRGWQK
jgi:hypothetical protein